jgi:inorganic triphosphatase YgiF
MSVLPVETEIRLAATADAGRRFAKAAAFERLTVSPPVTVPLASVYWDTPSHALRSDGVALRLRKGAGGRVTQTLKLREHESFSRNEFEAPARDDRPHLALAVEQGWRPSPSSMHTEPELRPIFSTAITRTSRTLTFADGTTAEIAFDRGSIRNESEPRSEVTVRELELELVAGDVRRLHELAAELVVEVPGLRLQSMSKADRGYALVSGAPMPPRRARPITVRRKATPGRIAVASAAEALSHVTENIDGVRGADDPEYVHQMRIGVRRLRVANALCRAAGLPTFSDRMTAELKWLWELLGSARDWDVFEAQTWPAIKADAGTPPDAVDVDAGISRERDASHRELRRAVDSPRFQRLILAAAWILANQRAEADAQRRAADTAATLSRGVLRQRQKKVLESGSAPWSLARADQHRLRIDAKKLRYLAEFCADLYPERSVQRYLRRLAKVQTALGGLNDLAMSTPLMQRVVRAEAGGDGDDRAVVGLSDHYVATRGKSLERDLQRAWRKFDKAPAFWK